MQISDDFLTGLDVADMKGAIAAEFLAGFDFVKNNPLNFDLWLVAVGMEEVDGSGSAKFTEWFKHQDFGCSEILGLIGEPTGNSQIEVGHRGN